MKSVAKERVTARQRRHRRVRNKVQGTAERPRLCISRSLNHIYAQIVNDQEQRTILTVSSLSKEIRDQTALGMKKSEVSSLVGKLVAEKAKAAGIESVTFDRGGYLYHGRVKAVAEGAREGGLKL